MTSSKVNAVRKAKLKSVRISRTNYEQAKWMAENSNVPLYRVIDNAIWQVWRVLAAWRASMTSSKVNAVRKAKLKSVRISRTNYEQAKWIAENFNVPLYRVIDDAIWQVWRAFEPIDIMGRR